jgi:hypothetical protein
VACSGTALALGFKERVRIPCNGLVTILNQCNFVKPACGGVSNYYWCVTAHNATSKWSKDGSGTDVFYQTSKENFFGSLFPVRSPFGYPDK